MHTNKLEMAYLKYMHILVKKLYILTEAHACTCIHSSVGTCILKCWDIHEHKFKVTHRYRPETRPVFIRLGCKVSFATGKSVSIPICTSSV